MRTASDNNNKNKGRKEQWDGYFPQGDCDGCQLCTIASNVWQINTYKIAASNEWTNVCII